MTGKRSRSMILLICLLCAPIAAASTDDELRLLALHEKAMRAHRESNVAILLENESADYVVANRGEISRPTLEDRRAMLGPYLESTRFDVYRDMTDPVVKVSADGSLGWVIVQVEARGTRTSESGDRRPVEFTSAWIELYEKRDGRWIRTGNVSNFRP